jgi:hypothetical protein
MSGNVSASAEIEHYCSKIIEFLLERNIMHVQHDANLDTMQHIIRCGTVEAKYGSTKSTSLNA